MVGRVVVDVDVADAIVGVDVGAGVYLVVDVDVDIGVDDAARVVEATCLQSTSPVTQPVDPGSREEQDLKRWHTPWSLLKENQAQWLFSLHPSRQQSASSTPANESRISAWPHLPVRPQIGQDTWLVLRGFLSSRWSPLQPLAGMIQHSLMLSQ